MEVYLPMAETAIQTQAQPQLPKRMSALEVLGQKLNLAPGKLFDCLKNTIFPVKVGNEWRVPTDEELMALVVVANEYGLNPMIRQIYAFPNKNGGLTPIVGVDGWIHIINAKPTFDGMTITEEDYEDGSIKSCTCTIHVKGRTHPTVITEYFDECFRETDPWRKMPRRMLRNKAIIQGGRVAFGLSGISDEDEARDMLVGQVVELPAPGEAPPATPEAPAPARTDDLKAKLKPVADQAVPVTVNRRRAPAQTQPVQPAQPVQEQPKAEVKTEPEEKPAEQASAPVENKTPGIGDENAIPPDSFFEQQGKKK